MEHKFQQGLAMKNAKDVILQVSKEFEEMTGRKYGLFEEYKMEDAEMAIVVLNSTAGTAKYTVEYYKGTTLVEEDTDTTGSGNIGDVVA